MLRIVPPQSIGQTTTDNVLRITLHPPPVSSLPLKKVRIVNNTPFDASGIPVPGRMAIYAEPVKNKKQV